MEDGGTAGAGAGGDAAGAAGAAGSSSSSSSKRARKAQKKGAQEISQANVVATLKRYGGRLASEVGTGGRRVVMLVSWLDRRACASRGV